MTRLSLAFSFICGLLLGCATPGSRPSDMTAEGHQEAAGAHAAEATEHAQQYDPQARASRRALDTADPGRKIPRYTVEQYIELSTSHAN